MHLMMCDYVKFDIGVFFPFFSLKINSYYQYIKVMTGRLIS